MITQLSDKVKVHHSDDDIFKLEILRSPSNYQWFKPLQECKILYLSDTCNDSKFVFEN